MKTTRHCLALDLKDDQQMIDHYVEYHKDVWPEIKNSLKESGIADMEIYLVQNRLFMIIEVDDSFSFEKKKILDDNNPVVQKWEAIMREFQQPLPGSEKGSWWKQMEKVFKYSA